MESDITGGPAFPTVGTDWNVSRDQWEVTTVHPGMTLRDWFAAKAMQADLSSWPEDASDWLKYRDDLARRYYQMADAMLAQRAKEQA